MSADNVRYYGVNACFALANARFDDIERAFVTEAGLVLAKKLLGALADTKRPYRVVPPEELEKVSGTSHHEGICLVAKPRAEPTLADVLDEADDDDDPVRLTEGFADAIVREFMTPAVISVSPSTTLKQICGVLARENIHRVVVTEHGKLLGIVTTTDIVRRLADDL